MYRFRGKVLLEKILRSCPEVAAIFVLGRSKRGVTLEQRFEEIFASELFAKLRDQSTEAFKKVKYVNGDMLKSKLGVSAEDLAVLQKEVDIVIHSAATVRFDAPLKDAFNMNICGTQKLLDIASTFKKLRVFVHISTCYANCDNKVIKERIYDSTYDIKKLMKVVKYLDEKALEKIQKDLLGAKPNTYTFTKHLTELLVQKYQKTVPFSITIVRPSIVVASMSEPFPGWVDNYNGPNGMICATACGLLKSIYSMREMRTDMIPVDVVAKTILIAAWRAGVTKAKEIEVYNCAIGDRAPSFTWGDFEKFQCNLLQKVTFSHAIRYPCLNMRRSWVLHKASMFIDHLAPAFIVDKVLGFFGKKPDLMKAYSKINAMQSALVFFTTHEWTFETENLARLSASLSEEDEEDQHRRELTEVGGIPA